MLNNYKLYILPDDSKYLKGKDRWMIVINTPKDGVRIPARDMNYEDALYMINPIKYAFEFGLKESLSIISTQLFNTDFRCEIKIEPEK